MGAFDNARVENYGSVRGADETGHDVFRLERDRGPTLYGDYFYVFPDERAFEYDFNIEIGVFGYRHRVISGTLIRLIREHFFPEEATAAEQAIRL